MDSLVLGLKASLCISCIKVDQIPSCIFLVPVCKADCLGKMKFTMPLLRSFGKKC